MRTVHAVKTELKRLVSFYMGNEFNGCIVAERGYHLVRGIDNMVGEGWFSPHKPVVNYRCSGPDEINITIKEYLPLEYDLTLTKGDIIND